MYQMILEKRRALVGLLAAAALALSVLLGGSALSHQASASDLHTTTTVVADGGGTGSGSGGPG